MVNDAILFESAEDLIKPIETALQDYKRGKDLARSPLAQSPLVRDCLLTGETPSARVEALGVSALLRWAVDQLRPGSKSGKEERGWRLYAVLHYLYLEGMTVEETATMLLAEPLTVVNLEMLVNYWRREALPEVANKLWREWQHPQHQPQRKHYAIEERYRFYQAQPLDQADKRRLLRFCALLHQPLSLQTLQEQAFAIGITDPQACIPQLVFDGWLVETGEDQATILRADEEVRAYLRSRLTPVERHDWGNRLGKLYETRQEYLETATQWCAAGQYQTAATTLIEHYPEIVAAGAIEQLYQLQEQFSTAQLDKTTMADLKIAMARAAKSVKNVDTKNIDRANKLLNEALNVPDVLRKAKAYYYLATLWHNARFEASRHHFERGIELLTDGSKQDEEERAALLADLYVGKAWLYMQVSLDLAIAEDALRQAERLLAKNDVERWSNWHNAWAGLQARRRDLEGEFAHLYQAVLTAREQDNREMLWKALHNLAQTYIHAQRFGPGLEYLQQAQALAEMLGNEEWVKKCEQTRGAACYYQQDYAQAIKHYQAAATVFARTGNDHWLGAAYADLTEAYLALIDLRTARHYYVEAMTCAKRANVEGLLNYLEELAQKQPILLSPLNERQLNALQEVSRYGQITNRRYRELTGVGKSTAERDLEKLIDLGLLVKGEEGGAGTKYVLPNHSV